MFLYKISNTSESKCFYHISKRKLTIDKLYWTVKAMADKAPLLKRAYDTWGDRAFTVEVLREGGETELIAYRLHLLGTSLEQTYHTALPTPPKPINKRLNQVFDETERAAIQEERKQKAKANAKLKHKENYKHKLAAHADRTPEMRAEWAAKRKENLKQRLKVRRTNDPVFKILEQIYRRVYQSLPQWLASRKASYTDKQLKEHIESMFRDGMTWDNHGKHWHLDHIKPVYKFFEEGVFDPSIFNDLSNLQPLLISEHHAKSKQERKV